MSWYATAKMATQYRFQSTSSEEDVVSCRHGLPAHTLSPFQSTSSEEDVVSGTGNTPVLATDTVSIHVLRRGRCVYCQIIVTCIITCFNPRPPKRTLCRSSCSFDCLDISVSIHVLRRGRCVVYENKQQKSISLVSIHVLRRGRCVYMTFWICQRSQKFQSTSSEEDVVSFQTL